MSRRGDTATRWMYEGRRPNGLARALNRLWATFSSAGVSPGRLVTLQVIGRRTGKPMSLPVVVATCDGDRYLVSMLGERASWVRNVRAADGRATLRHGRREAVRLEEVEPAARPPIVREYLDCAPGARPHVPVDRRAPAAQFDPVASQLPVFRIRSEP